MTKTEWNQSHPAQCSAYVEAWNNKQKRAETKAAEIKYLLAQPHCKKRLKVEDFTPEWAKPKRRKLSEEETEMRLKAALQSMAGRTK